MPPQPISRSSECEPRQRIRSGAAAALVQGEVQHDGVNDVAASDRIASRLSADRLLVIARIPGESAWPSAAADAERSPFFQTSHGATPREYMSSSNCLSLNVSIGSQKPSWR